MCVFAHKVDFEYFRTNKKWHELMPALFFAIQNIFDDHDFAQIILCSVFLTKLVMVFALIINIIASTLFLFLKISLDITKFLLFLLNWVLKFVQQLVFNASRKYKYLSNL